MTASDPTTEGTALTPGARLGPYEVQAPLGSGGMGEVYRVRDERLGREVAVKVLHGESSTDPDRLRRFEQEAKAAGALNHPNLVAVFDTGRHDGSPYVVFELLDGVTLRQRMGGGPLPVRKAVDYAVQIADGLAAAHERGIVHRDLKPENLFITKDGRVKVLDFGLAKLRPALDPHAPRGEGPTLSAAAGAGVVLGTVGYMSPEQVTRGCQVSLGAHSHRAAVERRLAPPPGSPHLHVAHPLFGCARSYRGVAPARAIVLRV